MNRPTREALIESLKTFHHTHNRLPRKDEAQPTAELLYPRKCYVNEFGSWNQALEDAGLMDNLEYYACDFYQVSACGVCYASFIGALPNGKCGNCVDSLTETD